MNDSIHNNTLTGGKFQSPLNGEAVRLEEDALQFDGVPGAFQSPLNGEAVRLIDAARRAVGTYLEFQSPLNGEAVRRMKRPEWNPPATRVSIPSERGSGATCVRVVTKFAPVFEEAGQVSIPSERGSGATSAAVRKSLAQMPGFNPLWTGKRCDYVRALNHK